MNRGVIERATYESRGVAVRLTVLAVDRERSSVTVVASTHPGDVVELFEGDTMELELTLSISEVHVGLETELAVKTR